MLHLVGGTPFSLTFRQAKELGGNIRKEAKGLSMIYYNATLFHELTHATGHASRLDRPDLAEALRPSGCAGSAREELTAEMSAAFLRGHAGLDPSATLENTGAYLPFWLEQLRGDKKRVVPAASRAPRAAEFILGTAGGDEIEPSAPEPTPPSASPAALVINDKPEDGSTTGAPVDAGAVLPRPPLPALPVVVLGQETLPALTAVVVSTQRIELTRLLQHPAFTDEQRHTATARILAEADPARLGRWLTNVMRQITQWEEHTLAAEAQHNSHFTASEQAPD